MRLIDADNFLENEMLRCKGIPILGTYTWNNIRLSEALKKAPTVDAEPVRHGKWTYTDAYPHWVCCSECYKKFLPNKDLVELYNIPTNYCPSCGAKMDL